MAIDLDVTINELLEVLEHGRPDEARGSAFFRYDPDEDVMIFVVSGSLASSMSQDVKALMEKFKAINL